MDSQPNHIDNLRETYLNQCTAMITYSIESGIKLDETAVSGLDQSLNPNEESQPTLATLAKIHNYLLDAIYPMTPKSLQIRNQERYGKTWLSRLSLIRKLMIVSLACLATLVIISLSGHVNGDPKNFNLFANSGYSLLLNELFLVASAGLGASFSALFRANWFVERGTYDPAFETSYWLHVILGVVAGTILGMLVPIEEIEKLVEGGQETHLSSLNGLGKPLLAIAGGFSAQLVYKALIKIVKFLESLMDTLIPNAYTPPSNDQTKPKSRDIQPLKLVIDNPRESNRPLEEDHANQSMTEIPAAIPPDSPDTTTNNQGKSELEFAKALITLGEGCRKSVYRDSLGIPTIGIGCNLNDKGNQELLANMGIDYRELIRGDRSLTEDQIGEIFSIQLQNCQNQILSIFDNYAELSHLRKSVLLDMIFNLGQQRLSKFTNFRAAIKKHDYTKAALEMKNSRWFQQVGQRGQRDIYIMEHDSLAGAPHAAAIQDLDPNPKAA